MATLTVSTNGVARGTQECHDVLDVEHIRFRGVPETRRDVAVLTMDIDQALAIAYDLLYQAVDAGKISGWNVQFPEAQEVPNRILGVDLTS